MLENPSTAKQAIRPRRLSRRTRSFAGSDPNHSFFRMLLASSASLQLLRRALDGFTYSHVRRAAAKISAHRFFNVLVCWFRRCFQQRNRAHDLSALTVTALNYVFFDPSVLHYAAHRILSHRFNGSDLPIANQCNRNDARPDCVAVHVHGARAAGTYPATVFRPGQLQLLT